MSSIGDYLRLLRTKRNLSLNDVFNSTGITTTRLNRIELGQVNEPSPLVLKKLSELYQVDLIKLYKMAGYLEDKDIGERVVPFSNYEILDNEECEYIQNTIDFFIRKNHR
ncbi:transcriptional regulator, XRE family [Thermanaerovibrio acidaminovorans DSM 6589]|jgi:transcriptional regulator with XRE-family HTH domain|uniref:Transcriptional regulator, XRE family n=1 Tax=Thermanaerovibrio acidaminovorans (strain ATCC 49978 / DSM 6589 / Su883) TaxID=525903 RepID=D1BA91_THEAS|nr:MULTISPECIES: helix-turn-helix transcriptional regulator [Bacteria]ACZ19194.1 transcriptional regulator, XRE family [Thermanaerovibrio acidaminovorans DSM 6589]MCL4385155.1 helix-turn-helix domain-containing protein [Cyanobacteriota bacterium]NLM60434.1 helix-turn-helix transcriptional regulator [Clostridium sp.]SCN21868.1 RapGH repressor [Clostridium sp. N3C]